MDMSSISTGFYVSGLGIGLGLVAVCTLSVANSNSVEKLPPKNFLMRLMQSLFAVGSRDSQGSPSVKTIMPSPALTEDILMDAITDITSDTMHIAYVYKSFHSALFVLKLHTHLYMPDSLSESQKTSINNYLALLERVETNITSIHKLTNKIKLIAIEGLKRSGKSSLIKLLVTKLPSRYRYLPIPSEVEETEEYFMSSAEPVARAFAVIRNYIAVYQIYEDNELNPLENRHYFIESFYHSTITSTIMSQVDNPEDSAIVPPAAYEWPIDLPIPHIVIYLNVPTDIRLRRLDAEAAVNCERSVHRSEERDEKIRTAYTFVKGPLTIGIEAEMDMQDVCDFTIEVLGEYGFIIPHVAMTTRSSKRSSVGVYSALSQLP